MLRITDGLAERRLRDPQAARGNIDALAFHTGHRLREALTFDAANQIFRRHRKILEMQLAGFDGLIAQLVDIAADG